MNGSILGRVGAEVFLNHQRHFEDDGIVKLAQVKAGQFLDLFKPVDQRVAVDKQTAACFRYIEVVFKEALDGEQRFRIQAVDAVLLEDLVQESFTQGGRQLVNQPCNAEVVVGDDLLFVVKYLANLHRDLGFLETGRQVLDVCNRGADADHRLI